MLSKRSIVVIFLSILSPLKLYADTVLISAYADKQLRDFDGDNFYEDHLNTDELRAAIHTGYVDVRSAIEFDLSVIDASSTITSAFLDLTLTGYSNISGSIGFEIHGYAGNGTIDSLDVTVDNLLTSYSSVPSPSSSADAPFYTIDVTDHINTTFPSGFSGFSIRLEDKICLAGCGLIFASSEFGGDFLGAIDYPPSLTINYSVSEVPAPTAAILFWSALVFLGGLKRKIKAIKGL